MGQFPEQVLKIKCLVEPMAQSGLDSGVPLSKARGKNGFPSMRQPLPEPTPLDGSPGPAEGQAVVLTGQSHGGGVHDRHEFLHI